MLKSNIKRAPLQCAMKLKELAGLSLQPAPYRSILWHFLQQDEAALQIFAKTECSQDSEVLWKWIFVFVFLLFRSFSLRSCTITRRTCFFATATAPSDVLFAPFFGDVALLDSSAVFAFWGWLFGLAFAAPRGGMGLYQITPENYSSQELKVAVVTTVGLASCGRGPLWYSTRACAQFKDYQLWTNRPTQTHPHAKLLSFAFVVIALFSDITFLLLSNSKLYMQCLHSMSLSCRSGTVTQITIKHQLAIYTIGPASQPAFVHA